MTVQFDHSPKPLCWGFFIVQNIVLFLVKFYKILIICNKEIKGVIYASKNFTKRPIQARSSFQNQRAKL